MKKHQKSERGQALILIVFAIIGLIGITGLTVDGGLAYSDRRHAQNAADTAAYAAALAKVKGNDLEDAGWDVAEDNGYPQSAVNITTAFSPNGVCPAGSTDNLDITVTITSVMNTSFARVVGINTMTNTVIAKSRACGTYIAPLFNGNAIVGLNPSLVNCGFDSGQSNSAKWIVKGGGIFSNGCAYSKNSNSVTFDTGYCATAVGAASNFSCSNNNQTSQKINYPADVLAIMPPNPCDGTPGDVGLPQPSVSGDTVTLSNGVYCITDFDDYDSADIVLENATMYVVDEDFDLKFAGGGGFSGTPTVSGTYNSYYMIIAYNGQPCESFAGGGNVDKQAVVWRGNGLGTLYGTVLAPSACLDYRGNADASSINSQVIGYTVTSNGTANVYVNYKANENRRDPQPPTISLIE